MPDLYFSGDTAELPDTASEESMKNSILTALTGMTPSEKLAVVNAAKEGLALLDTEINRLQKHLVGAGRFFTRVLAIKNSLASEYSNIDKSKLAPIETFRDAMPDGAVKDMLTQADSKVLQIQSLLGLHIAHAGSISNRISVDLSRTNAKISQLTQLRTVLNWLITEAG